MLPNHVVRDMDQFRVLFRPDPCAYACLSQPGPPSLFAQVIMEQNELFYATFPEARRADEERRQERSQLLTKYWQKLEYYGLPMHFGSPFFPRDIGEEGWYHDPGHVEYPADESYSSFASFSTTAAHVGPSHSPASLGDMSAVGSNIFNHQYPPQDTFQSPANGGLRSVANTLSPDSYDHPTDSSTTRSFGVGMGYTGTLHQARTPQVPIRFPQECDQGHQPSHSPHRHFQQHPHQSQRDQRVRPSQLPPLDLSSSSAHSMGSEDDESVLSSPVSSHPSRTNKSPDGSSWRRNSRGGAMRLSPLPTNKRQAEKKPPLACLFCRGRKIACGAPLPGSLDKTCNQCQRRSLPCHYPTESRRGMRKKKAAEGSKDVIDQSLPGEAVLTP